MIGQTVWQRVESTTSGSVSTSCVHEGLGVEEAQSGRWCHENGLDDGSQSAGTGDEAVLVRVQEE